MSTLEMENVVLREALTRECESKMAVLRQVREMLSAKEGELQKAELTAKRDIARARRGQSAALRKVAVLQSSID
jgi:hypothetical protein